MRQGHLTVAVFAMLAFYAVIGFAIWAWFQ